MNKGSEIALKAQFDTFIGLADKNVLEHPWLVVVLMHDYFRNIFPSDPHLPFGSEPAAQRIKAVLLRNIRLLNDAKGMRSYFNKGDLLLKGICALNQERAAENTTAQVYGKLWDRFDITMYLKSAREILEERLAAGRLDLSYLKGKTLIDIGCGSGRFTVALAQMTKAKMVYGVDLGESSLDQARQIARRAGIKNVKFQRADVLKLPFADATFDFVFSNGVLHHTTDMEQGLREFYRVLKPKAWSYLYLYGDGGLYWYSRKRMPQVMQKIPQEYTMEALRQIGMPLNRFIFEDNWYVPLERHVPRVFLEKFLDQLGFDEIRKIESHRKTDLEFGLRNGDKVARSIWGDGENRYFLYKG